MMGLGAATRGAAACNIVGHGCSYASCGAASVARAEQSVSWEDQATQAFAACGRGALQPAVPSVDERGQYAGGRECSAAPEGVRQIRG